MVIKEKILTVRDMIFSIFTLTGLLYALVCVSHELEFKGFCPSVLGVPSSYFYANSFLIIMLSVFLKGKLTASLLFNLGVLLGLFSSIYFSVMHLLMISLSPSYLNITSCYLMFLLFCIIGTVKHFRLF